jgi:hypothetical protein
MRTILAYILLVAVSPATFVHAGDKTDEAAAIAKIQALDGQVCRKNDGGAISRGIRTPEGTPTAKKDDENPVVLVDLVGSEKLKDDDLKCLQAFPELTDLYIGRTATTDAGLKHLLPLKHLRMIGLIGTKITDAGLAELSGLKQLQILFLGNTAITDAGLRHLAKLENLQQILLFKTKITDAGLKELQNCPALENLSLAGTSISDAGLKHLAKLEQLSVLNLTGTKITDAGLKELSNLKHLRQLVTAETMVTDAGAKQLKTSLPKLRVGRQAMGQRSDPDFDVSVAHPAYTQKHPTVLFDEAHQNFHTASGRYKVFADLMHNDGYRITPNTEPVTADRLPHYDIFVTANAPGHDSPTKSAFTPDECDSIANWVRNGGSLLLITDHEPFGSGSEELGKRFGVDMSLRVSVDQANETGNGLLFSREKHQLGDHAILRGRNDSERVDRVLTFTGQSLLGPPGSVQLLKFADTAEDVGFGQTEDRRSAKGRAQGIAFKFGKGRVVVMGEAGDLSAQVYGDPPTPMGMNVPGCDNRKFALNLMHWLSGLVD